MLAGAYISGDRTESKKWDDTGCPLQRHVALHVVTVVEYPVMAPSRRLSNGRYQITPTVR